MNRRLKSAVIFSLVLFASTASIFALSAEARIILTGNFVEETQKTDEIAEYDVFKLNSKPQKDDDGIVVDFSGGTFGGRLALWYQFDQKTANEGSALSFRRSNIWFKPLENLKFTVGFVGNDQLYKERIDEWKVGNPFNLNEREWTKHPGYINCSDVDEMGFGVEYRPMDGWIMTAGMSRKWGTTPGGFDAPFWQFDGIDSMFSAWGITSRYYRDNFCYQLSFRDNGSKDWKVARAAVGYEANGIYAFVQPCFGIDWVAAEEKYKMTGLCFDLYGEYKIGSWAFIGRCPVTLRFTKDDNDPSYFEYLLYAKYNFGTIGNMGDFSTYLSVGSLNHDGDKPYAFYKFGEGFTDSVNFDAKAGVIFMVGAVEFDVAFELLYNSNDYMNTYDHVRCEWRVPFTTEIRF